MIAADRIHKLNDKPARDEGGFVLYWMQQSQRAEYNHALEYAVERANRLDLPLLVLFALMDNYPEANERHYTFMLQGLAETFDALRDRGMLALCGRGFPPEVAARAAEKAALVVCDQGYLRHQAEWREQLAASVDCEAVEIESDIVVPVESASDHAEYMARTLRPKIHAQMDANLTTVPAVKLSKAWKSSWRKFPGLEDFNPELPDIAELRIDRAVAAVKKFRGGRAAAKERLEDFIQSSLAIYSEHSNRPETDDISMLSPYLHFGQISPVYIAREIERCGATREAKDAYLEQLLVRRELAINFCWFTPDYDSMDSLPNWARQTLNIHAEDRREHIYSTAQFEDAETHDPYWNAAMREMVATGFMHNYMRMYWGKKILEWSPDPETAYATALELNNKYFLDGRDPNSYAGVAWIFGKHDQAWKERPIFGKTRYMNANGLRRKCDIDAYVARFNKTAIRALTEED